MKIFLYVVFLIISIAELRSQPMDCKNPLIDSIAVVKCIAIVDGDTWKFQLRNDIFSIRILGIDCFETKHTTRLHKQAEKNNISLDSALTLGLRAKHTADSLFLGKDVTIIRDSNEKNFDFYNRLLRHCFFGDMINYADYIKQQGLSANEKEE